ncbi:MAG: galactose mutarotase [Saprospiraceae bacterium]|nr:galactose mutarotase [Saprospiraceae bacterium]
MQSPTFTISSEEFGQTEDGHATLYTLANDQGMVVKITNYGAIITSIIVPDREGTLADVVLGFDELDDYLHLNPYFGAVIGRYGNRIGSAQFEINDTVYNLAANNGENHLHGGLRGFDKYLWQADTVLEKGRAGLHLRRISPHLEEGYPGSLEVEVIYWLDNDNGLTIDYKAASDRKTVCNLTNHSYFNLRGAGNGNILAHEIMIKSEAITPVDAGLIPTGDLMAVAESPFDFREPRAIGDRIDDGHPQITAGGGYDHNFVIRRASPSSAELVATAYDPESGRFMEVLTSEPGLQFYTGNFLDGTIKGKGGNTYPKRSGFCMETQHYPDSPNKPNFPSVLLSPGQSYETTTTYRFKVR